MLTSAHQLNQLTPFDRQRHVSGAFFLGSRDEAHDLRYLGIAVILSATFALEKN
jgi:hypothetical protein